MPISSIFSSFPRGAIATSATTASGSSDYSFPSDLGQDGNHFVTFTNYKYSRATRTSQARKNAKGSISLPMPGNLATSYNAEYTNESLGIFGTQAMNFAANNRESVQNLFQGQSGAGASKFEELHQDSNNGSLGSTSLAAVIKFALDRYGTNPIVAGASVGAGIARNPHQAVLFHGVGFRTHSFQYNLVARNQQESTAIKNIITKFKTAMLPSYVENTGQTLFEYPDEFDITFSNKSNLFTISTSVLKDFGIEYHGEGVPLYFQDSKAPVSVTITLVFQETTITTRDEVQQQGR